MERRGQSKVKKQRLNPTLETTSVKELAYMRVTTRDPMSGRDVSNPKTAPYVMEGHGGNALKICFENEHNKQEYLAIEPHVPEACSLNLYRTFEDNDEILWD